jgi:hypothetical protein
MELIQEKGGFPAQQNQPYRTFNVRSPKADEQTFQNPRPDDFVGTRTSESCSTAGRITRKRW